MPYNGTRFVFATVLALLFGSILWGVGQERCARAFPTRSNVRRFCCTRIHCDSNCSAQRRVPFKECAIPYAWCLLYQPSASVSTFVMSFMPFRWLLIAVVRRRGTLQAVGNVMGSLYLSVLFLGIINSRTVQPVASEERAVSYRERAAGVSPFLTLNPNPNLNLFNDSVAAGCHQGPRGVPCERG